MMKKTNFIWSAMGLMLLASCSSQTNCPDEDMIDSLGGVQFTATIEDHSTRAMGTKWEANDAIGVYAVKSGQPLSDENLHKGKGNKKFTTPGDGKFKAAANENADNVVEFPETGDIDFVAYYPYDKNLKGYDVKVNVADQTNSSAIDLLYSDNATKQSKSSKPTLNFNHKLSLLILNVTHADATVSLDGLTTSIDGLKVDGSMNLANKGVVTPGNSVATITPKSVVTNGTAAVAAILVPGQNLSSAKISFALGGKVFEWTPEAIALESGKKYTYNVKLTGGSVTAVEVTTESNIADWNEGATGTTDIILNPNTQAQFVASTSNLAFGASANLSSSFNLTAEATQAWTATPSDAWVKVSPAAGTGAGAITVTADANTTQSNRTATITLTATGSAFDPITITVSQDAAASTPETPAGTLLAPWSDFEDWTLFTNSLNSFGLKDYATQNATGGMDGKSALQIKTSATGNDYVFTAVAGQGLNLAGKSKIILWVKGTASAKSMSFNVYIGSGKVSGTDYKCYNVGVMNSDVVLDPTDKNDYLGSIDTGGQWKKITLNISGLTINSGAGQDVFALKIGKSSDWNILVDNITVE